MVPRAASTAVRPGVVYLVMLGLSLCALAAVYVWLLPPASDRAFLTPAASEHADTVTGVLLALVAVVISAQILGALLGALGQPPVIGEVVAGIALGPSLLGRFAPNISATLFPSNVTPMLSLIAQVGVIGYMFLVGLSLNLTALRKRTSVALTVSHASILAPFVLGVALSTWLYRRFAPPGVPPIAFALFVGVALSVTAFPVLARILRDRGLESTRIGTIAIACAAVDDVTAWCLLALVESIATKTNHALTTLLLTAGFIAGMLLLVSPLATRLAREYDTNPRVHAASFGLVCLALVASALATKHIGIHALFGAFLLGAVIPHDSNLAKELREKLESVIVTFMLPAFFAYTGLRTQVALVNDRAEVLALLFIVGVATLGKLAGTALAARAAGVPWRESMGLGVLMNTRGLMELIVLNVGLDLGILSPTLFALFVLMAIITTVATGPVLALLRIDPNATGALTTLPPPPH